jgi:hypothetical protein
MSARRKSPSVDENKKTAIFESGKHGRRAVPADEAEVDPTVVDGPLARSFVEDPPPNAGPTVLAKPAKRAPSPQRPAIQAISMKERSGDIQAISMKTPGGAPPTAEVNPPTPILPRPKLRAVSEVTPVKAQNLGHVAPPYDPERARARRVREYVIGGCVAVILACAIALVVWFVAR